jgi:dTDP-4-dehydrorhamnose 3,5-epimerase
MSNNKWDEFQITPSKKFGLEVPVIQPSIFREFRGEIWTTFHSEKHPVMNYVSEGCETHGRFSRSYKGVLRGLHYDYKTWKLVQAVMGEMYLVVLDMRKDSPTYGDWESFIITERLRNQVLVPPGFANGYYSLTDCMFHYNLFYKDEYVDTDKQGVVKWNDPEFQIEWPTDNPILQKRDK